MQFIQLLRIMRIITFLVFVATFQVAAKTHSQTVTLKVKDVPLKEVFKLIQAQTGYNILVDVSIVEKLNPASIDVKDMPVAQVMKLLVERQPLDFTIRQDAIVVKEKVLKYWIDEVPPIIGIVRGPDGQPLAGVNVMVKGTNKGVVTDLNGKFSIEAEQGKTLVISNIGYTAKEIKIKGDNAIVVGLEISTSKLDEVQIIAYGTSSQRFQTGNVSSIKAKDIEKSPINNPLLALQARVPGINITQASGLPGGAIKVRVQGQNSIENGNTPLYVVDGVPYPSAMPGWGMAPLGNPDDRVLNTLNSASTGSALSYLLPSDIESIEVLKDADATAIYGSRAANGAILITTKKAKAGKTTLDVNWQTGWSRISRWVEMLNTQQYLEMRREGFYNDSIEDPINYQGPTEYTSPDLLVWDTTRYTDWQKELLGGAATSKIISAALSGGSEFTKYTGQRNLSERDDRSPW